LLIGSGDLYHTNSAAEVAVLSHVAMSDSSLKLRYLLISVTCFDFLTKNHHSIFSQTKDEDFILSFIN
jgi:hypothetical protein